MGIIEFLRKLFGLDADEKETQVATEPKVQQSVQVSQTTTTSSSSSTKKQDGTIQVGTMPTSLSDIQSASWFNRKDFNTVAAAAICAFDMYGTSKETAIEVLDFLKGPNPLSTFDKQFLKDRLSNKKYLAKSYFEGATPKNNYTPSSPLKIKFSENPYSRTEFDKGYITIFAQSGGADSPRQIKLRNKPSTGEWFLWSYDGILVGIRIPDEQNDWA